MSGPPHRSCPLQTVAATEAAIQQYQQIVARGGFPQLARGERLRLGMRSEP